VVVPGSLDNIFIEKLKAYPHEVLSTEPWIVRVNHFLSEREISALAYWAHKNGLKRSTDQGEIDNNGVQAQVTSNTRTSENAWCMAECESDPTIDNLLRRVENMLDIPRDHYENLQLLRYLPGQYYKRHHDSSERDNLTLHGPRILTLFFYINDVEGGGETRFTDLKPPLDIIPMKGTMVIWPSVTNRDPTQIDYRTHHEAITVTKGVKYGANLWIHLRNFRLSNHHGCGGNFS
jgi:prolyl 4-hydroxylase